MRTFKFYLLDVAATSAAEAVYEQAFDSEAAATEVASQRYESGEGEHIVIECSHDDDAFETRVRLAEYGQGEASNVALVIPTLEFNPEAAMRVYAAASMQYAAEYGEG